MIVTIVATCCILIQSSVFASFDQETYRSEVELERKCKDLDNKYMDKCVDWYKQICVDEHNENELHPYILEHNKGMAIELACRQYINFTKSLVH